MDVGDEKIIKVETFIPENHEPTDADIRVRPLEGQGLSTDLRVECPRSIRSKYPVGTKFKMKARLIERYPDALILYNHHSWLMDPIDT